VAVTADCSSKLLSGASPNEFFTIEANVRTTPWRPVRTKRGKRMNEKFKAERCMFSECLAVLALKPFYPPPITTITPEKLVWLSFKKLSIFL
jgi:hypothetical protein